MTTVWTDRQTDSSATSIEKSQPVSPLTDYRSVPVVLCDGFVEAKVRVAKTFASNLILTFLLLVRIHKVVNESSE